MGFPEDEKSVAVSAPVELYEFVTPATTYRYTSFHSDFSWNFDLWTAIPGLVRSEVVVDAQNDAPELVVTLPGSASIVLGALVGIPLRSLTCKVRRVQQNSGVALVWWSGPVTSWTLSGATGGSGDIVTIRVPSAMDDALATQIPAEIHSPLCNHALYDIRCTVLREDFDQAATVSSISGKEITVNTVGGNPDQWFKGGEIVRDSDGERRTIVDQTGTVLTIDMPFRTLAGGNAVTLFAGCDHLGGTCRDKFDNIINFGGFPYVPRQNPFESSLRGLF